MKKYLTLLIILLTPSLKAIEPNELVVTYYVIKKADNTPLGWDRQDTTWEYYRANRNKHKKALLASYAKQGASKVTHTYVPPGQYGFLYRYTSKGKYRYATDTYSKTESERQKSIQEKEKYGHTIIDVHGSPQKIITTGNGGKSTTKGGSE